MSQFTTWGIISTIIGKLPWTLALSLIAFLGGALVAALLTLITTLGSRVADACISATLSTIQSMPLLMLMFLCFFGLPLLKVNVSPLLAASVALIAFTAAFLTETWRAALKAVPRGQWEAAISSGMKHGDMLRVIVLPQALRIATPTTVGFLVQVVKATALASIVGFMEITRAGTVLNNITYRPFLIFAIIGVLYMAINLPISLAARHLERRFNFNS
ncbi:Amino acid ABC transporter membrane protein 2, PAAT family [Hyphomicrobiales bacterium]|nr:Amino acid ABC transporter membrane protein 2, PAAT family [Hyphomicrobiales bacterium]CAH1691198.1 Amino acid ABC transporter membrane protein 2, PAAT family [Hyphomicrobiales bacterium]